MLYTFVDAPFYGNMRNTAQKCKLSTIIINTIYMKTKQYVTPSSQLEIIRLETRYLTATTTGESLNIHTYGDESGEDASDFWM